MFEIGRLCVKIAGRDAGLKCVVVEILDNTYVMIDGQTRRRKCNVKHLEPLKEVIKVKTKATHKDVVVEFKKLKIEIIDSKPKKKTSKPVKQRRKKEKLNDENSSKEVIKKTEIKVNKDKIVKNEKNKVVKVVKKKTTKKSTIKSKTKKPKKIGKSKKKGAIDEN